MASPQQEIQQLRRQIADANRTIQENESRNQAALCRTITELQKQYEKARNDQQQDYAARLRRIEESFSNVYMTTSLPVTASPATRPLRPLRRQHPPKECPALAAPASLLLLVRPRHRLRPAHRKAPKKSLSTSRRI